MSGEIKPPEATPESKPAEKPEEKPIEAPAPPEKVPPVAAPAAQKKRIEVDEEEFEGMKKRLGEIEARRKKTDSAPAPAPAPRKRPIDRLHRGIFGR